MNESRHRTLTYKVQLPGRQGRLRDAILYIADKCKEAERFGLVKLNKMLWKADFDAFRERGQPVTGRQYKRQKDGPVPYEMRPLLDEMLGQEQIRIEQRLVRDLIEKRVIPIARPSLHNFSPADLSYLDRAVKFYWEYTGTEASDHSHGVAWRTRENGDDMPYELAYLSDAKLAGWEKQYYSRMAKAKRWVSA